MYKVYRVNDNGKKRVDAKGFNNPDMAIEFANSCATADHHTAENGRPVYTVQDGKKVVYRVHFNVEYARLWGDILAPR